MIIPNNNSNLYGVWPQGEMSPVIAFRIDDDEITPITMNGVTPPVTFDRAIGFYWDEHGDVIAADDVFTTSN